MPETTVPGRKAKHAYITDVCRTNRGDDGAIEEALNRLREEFKACADAWKIGDGTEFHLVLTVHKRG